MRTVKLSLAILFAGCTASVDAVQAPVDELFYPTGIAVDPDERVLFVANANSVLQYNAGTIAVVDLDVVDSVISSWGSGVAPDGCTGDREHLETLICDEAMFFTGAIARTGNFASAIAVQGRSDGARLFIPTRGDPSVTWVDWDGSALSCSPDSETCNDAHRLAAIGDDGFLPEEPFDAATGNGFAVISHLTNGTVTLIDSPVDGDATIADVTSGLFAADSDGNAGASGIAVRESSEGDIIYVGSSHEDRIQLLTVGRPVNNAPPFLLQGEFFFLDGVGGNSGSSADTRALTFERDRLYTINRNPPSLQIFETPANRFTGAFDICRVASRLAIVNDRAYVTCFQDGQLYAIDPATGASDIITVGRGAFDVAVSRTRNRIYVTNFLEDTIAVLDVDPLSPLRDRVVLRIGTARD